MTEKVGKILNQIKKELEGIKNELKKSNAFLYYVIPQHSSWLVVG